MQQLDLPDTDLLNWQDKDKEISLLTSFCYRHNIISTTLKIMAGNKLQSCDANICHENPLLGRFPQRRNYFQQVAII